MMSGICVQVRTALQHYSEDDISAPSLKPSGTFFDTLLSLLSSLGKDKMATWDGSLASLNGSTEGEMASKLATWEVLMDRWLTVVE